MKLVALSIAALSLAGCLHHDNSPLARAAAAGNVNELARLLDAGADPNGFGLHAPSPLIAAARAGQVGAVRLLVKRGADPNRRGGVNGWTPLMHAIHKNRKDVVAVLLKAGADVNGRGNGGSTALIMAAGYGYADLVRMLLQAGADPEARTRSGENALASAVNGTADIDRFTLGSCQTETVKVLLDWAPALRPTSDWNTRLGRCPEVAALLARSASRSR